MQQLFGLILKDFMSFSRTYLGYALIFVYMSISAAVTVYFGQIFSGDVSGMAVFFSTQPLIFCFIVPVVAAKIFGAEEEKTGNFEFLLTNPVKYKTILLAKFWAVFAYSCLLCLLSVMFAIYISLLIKVEVLLLVSGYIGLILLISVLSSLCCIANIVSRNIFVGFLVAAAISLLIYALDFNSLSIAILTIFGIYSPVASEALSLSENYLKFAHGEISLASCLFFATLICFCFFAAYLIFMYSRQKFQKKEVILSISFSAIAYILFGLSFKILFPTASIDLTNDNIYTISDKSRQIINNIKDRVDIKLYISDKFTDSYGNYNQYVSYVVNIMEEYASLSNKITFEVLNPKPYSPEAKEASDYGLEPILDKNGNVLYFGAVMMSGENRLKVIPVFLKERSNALEHDITWALKELGTVKQKPFLGIAAPNLPILKQTYNDDFEEWAFLAKLSKYYDIVRIGESGVPNEVKTVLLINPHKISGAMRKSLEQHILRGGNVVILADSYSEAEMEYASLINPRPVDLNYFLNNFGIVFDDDYVVSNVDRAGKVLMPEMENMAFYDYPIWLNIQKDDLRQKDIFKNISSLELHSASQMVEPNIFNEIVEDGEFIPLILLNKDNALVPAEYMNRDNLAFNKGIATDIDDPVILGAMVKGKYSIARRTDPSFEDDILLTQSIKDSVVAVIGDSDFIFNDSFIDKEKSLGLSEYLFVEKNDNMQFLINLLAYIDGEDFGQDIIRPLTYEENSLEKMLRKKVESKYKKAVEEKSSELALIDFSLVGIDRAVKYSRSVISPDVAKEFNELKLQREDLLKERKELDYYIERDFSAEKAAVVVFLVLWLPLLTTLFVVLLYLLFLYWKKNSVRSVM